ncbi:MAG: 1,4-dihydroxy-6-naphthoate synthase [Desulfovibrionaceae bacterium]|nr:1,4-dihydroxy-6-naphthoate synthase [Desulfovibrionaceae bacterium]
MNALGMGISSCPNDTYIFHALFAGITPPPLPVRMHMADVEELNGLAMRGVLEVTKLSLGVVPYIMDKYALLSAGAALGWGCGPLVIARGPMSPQERAAARVAIPGERTTANMLLGMTGQFHGPREPMLFSDVMAAVREGRADCGVIIHEGRFTYEAQGFTKLLDLGRWWEEAFHAPLPLGAIAVRRDVPREVALGVQEAIRASVLHANACPQDSREFIRTHAQELSEDVTAAHIRTFVTEFSVDLGAPGREAITRMVEKAAATLGRRIPDGGLFL